MNDLEPFRRRLDVLDDEIARLLGERFGVCREIALFKRYHDIPMMQPDRVEQVRSRYLARGAEVQLPADFTAELFELLIGATCRMEDELIARMQPGVQDEGLAHDGSLARDGLGDAAHAPREGGVQ
jgi:chorismate mutase